MCVCVCCFVCRVLGVVCLRSLSLAVFTSLTYTHILAHTHTHIARTWKISRAHMYVAHYRNKHRPTHTHTPNNYTIVHSDALGVRLYCMRWKHGINPSLFYCWFVDAIWYTALIFVFIFFFCSFLSLCVCVFLVSAHRRAPQTSACGILLFFLLMLLPTLRTEWIPFVWTVFGTIMPTNYGGKSCWVCSKDYLFFFVDYIQ